MNNLNSLNNVIIIPTGVVTLFLPYKYEKNVITIPTGVIEPLLEYIYEKNEKFDFTSIMILERVCSLWKIKIQNMPRYKTNVKFNNIRVLKSDKGCSIGILGIGYKLTAEHIGQHVFRCAPLGNDWSYTPDGNSKNKLIRITKEHFYLEFPLCSSRELNRSDYDDKNWILSSDLQKFISTYPFNRFKSEFRLIRFDDT